MVERCVWPGITRWNHFWEWKSRLCTSPTTVARIVGQKAREILARSLPAVLSKIREEAKEDKIASIEERKPDFAKLPRCLSW